MLQKLLHEAALLWPEWAKSPLIVDEHDARFLKSDDHVGPMIAVDIDEAEGHRNKVGIVSIELGTDVDTSVSSITTSQFDDFDAPMEVNDNEMAGIAWCFVM